MNSDIQLATLISYDSAGTLTANTIVLTYATIKDVNRCQPTAAQAITLPSIATLQAAGYPPGARFLFTKGVQTFSTTISPDAADSFFGQAVASSGLILRSGVQDAYELQIPISGSTQWIVTAVKSYGHSEATFIFGAGGQVLTAATIADTVIATPSAGGQITLPTIASLYTAGYPPGYEFAVVTDGAFVVTVIPGGADTFLAGPANLSFAATAVPHGALFRMPRQAGGTAWFVPSRTPT